ncbi:MAG: hemolysin [Lentimicrobiaceae bacterium]|jgi:putative hemolysin|nr:hemolysin [Lentimicrobiaceae bacterium]MDG1902182.1 hemolysin family protein [Bacteroidales bacterium]MDG2080513.1 hemolysin family protein [Bacteroidales bacterium]|tara:strand:+ start:22891 stop:24159 length:1269 start_codon:yes stop_codon:yes gene_type:complete
MSTNGLIIIFSLLFSGFFSGMEIAFVSSNRLVQELDLKRKIIPARILSAFFNHPSRFIGALLLGNNIALVIYGIAIANLLEPLIIDLLLPSINSEYAVLLCQTIISTLLILLVAEFIPKVLFRIRPNAILKAFALPVWLFYYLFYPLILLYIGVSELILKVIFRVKLAKESYSFSAVDLEEYVKDSLTAGGDTNEEINKEIQMIQNAMDFKHVKLRECMVPRTEIKALEIGKEVEEYNKMLVETGHSKIFIYEDTIDKIIGYVHVYDLLNNPLSVKEVIREIEPYPETMPANELLQKFISGHKSSAIVLDEFGGTAGIVTMEDIIEEIFGEIEDEHDNVEDVERQISDNTFLFSARLEIDYLNEKYKFNIPVLDDYETLAGYLIHNYSSIPNKGEVITISPYKFTVIKSSGNKLEELKMVIE